MTATVLRGPVLPWDGGVLCRGTVYDSLFVDRVVRVEGERFLLIHPAVDMENDSSGGVCMMMRGAVVMMRLGALLLSTQGGFSVRWRRGIVGEFSREEAELILSWPGEVRSGPVILPPRVPLWDGVVIVGMEEFAEPPVDGVEDRVWFWFSPYIVDEGGNVNVVAPKGKRFPFPLANAAFLATIAAGRVLVDSRFVDVEEVVEALRGTYEAIYGTPVQQERGGKDGEEGRDHRL